MTTFSILVAPAVTSTINRTRAAAHRAEITCAVDRAGAVITMVMMALSDGDGRPADHVLNDALWCAQSQLALIKKMAYHAFATTEPINKSAANPAGRG